MLQVTSEMMNSKNYKDRFIAEYFQVKIRLDKLKQWSKLFLFFLQSAN